MTEKELVACPLSFFPYSIDALAKLPAREALFAAYHFELGGNIGG